VINKEFELYNDNGKMHVATNNVPLAHKKKDKGN